MRTLIIIVVLIILFTVGCGFYYMDYSSYDFDDGIESINSPKDASRWCLENIDYVHDDLVYSEEYWQTPEETYNLGTGDCEDSCIMFMYLITKYLNLDSYMISVPDYVNGMKFSQYHVIVRVCSEEVEIYDPTNQVIPTTCYDGYEIIREFNYGEVMFQAYFYHKGIK